MVGGRVAGGWVVGGLGGCSNGLPYRASRKLDLAATIP